MAAKNTPVDAFKALSEAFDKANADGKLNNAGGRLTKAVKKAIEAVGLDPKTDSLVEKLLYEFLAFKGVTVKQVKTKNVTKQSVMDLLRDALDDKVSAEDAEVVTLSVNSVRAALAVANGMKMAKAIETYKVDDEAELIKALKHVDLGSD